MKPGVYKHHKGGLYHVHFEAKHSETLEDLVCYEQLSTKTFWVRPKSMFEETLEKNGQKIPRFAYISPSLKNS